MGDKPSYFALTSKIPPLDSKLNFDADVKTTTRRHQCENGFKHVVVTQQNAHRSTSLLLRRSKHWIEWLTVTWIRGLSADLTIETLTKAKCATHQDRGDLHR